MRICDVLFRSIQQQRDIIYTFSHDLNMLTKAITWKPYDCYSARNSVQDNLQIKHHMNLIQYNGINIKYSCLKEQRTVYNGVKNRQ